MTLFSVGSVCADTLDRSQAFFGDSSPHRCLFAHCSISCPRQTCLSRIPLSHCSFCSASSRGSSCPKEEVQVLPSYVRRLSSQLCTPPGTHSCSPSTQLPQPPCFPGRERKEDRDSNTGVLGGNQGVAPILRQETASQAL